MDSLLPVKSLLLTIFGLYRCRHKYIKKRRREEEEIIFNTITTISIIGKGDSGDPPSRCLVKGRERVADPVAESTLTGTVQ